MIKAQNLVKWFGPKLAVDDVSFQVNRGEVLGFLGPNGAGKSTTMRMLTGFLPPSSGTVEIDGHDIRREAIAAKAAVGYLPENAPAYPEMTVHGFLSFVAELHGLRGRAKREAVDRVVEICSLQSVCYQTIETLSKGYRHRTGVAQAILADPPVLVLDEPTDGLDPNQKQGVRDLIKRMGQTKAIIISTHILEEVDAVCSRLIIIDQGRLVFNGSPDRLRRRSERAGAVTLRVLGRAAAEVTPLLASLAEVERTFVLEEASSMALLRVFPKRTDDQDPPALAGILAAKLQEEKVLFDELHTETGRLDEVFRNMTVSETDKEVRA
jgi:ABC-2 type transport system ATP-binding protein